jgi:hypothetical protein
VSRLFSTLVVLAGLIVLVAGAVLQPAAAAGPGWIAHHETPWLAVRGQPLALPYEIDGRGRPYAGPISGAVYVRNSEQRSYTRVPLAARNGALVARISPQETFGRTLSYYAVLRDRAGRSMTVPAMGARRPERLWTVDRLLPVPLGTHRFGQLHAPEAIVARTGPKEVGFVGCMLDAAQRALCADGSNPPATGGCGCGEPAYGPSSFDVASDGSIWLLDEVNSRLLVWQRGKPARPARVIQLPRNLAVTDFALGSPGTIYLYATDHIGPGHSYVYALTATGRLRWKMPARGSPPLRLGPDGVLYTPFGSPVRSAWTPLTTRDGQRLPLTEQRRRATPFQPLPGGLRLVTMQPSSREVRFGLIDRTNALVRAWRVTSRTELYPLAATAALVRGDLVVAVEVSRPEKWEHLVLRLAPGGGTRQQVALDAHALWGSLDSPSTPLRIGPDGRLYQLRTNPTTGASIARYSLGPA